MEKSMTVRLLSVFLTALIGLFFLLIASRNYSLRKTYTTCIRKYR